MSYTEKAVHKRAGKLRLFVTCNERADRLVSKDCIIYRFHCNPDKGGHVVVCEGSNAAMAFMDGVENSAKFKWPKDKLASFKPTVNSTAAASDELVSELVKVYKPEQSVKPVFDFTDKPKKKPKKRIRAIPV